jgi:hypothetical protein
MLLLEIESFFLTLLSLSKNKNGRTIVNGCIKSVMQMEKKKVLFSSFKVEELSKVEKRLDN